VRHFRINGQSPAPDEESDDSGLDLQPHGLASCDVCGNDSAVFWLNLGPLPHTPGITFPPRLRGCARCERFAREADVDQLIRFMYASGGLWLEDRAGLRPIAEAFVENFVSSAPLAR
jgi:hypothetical protein